MNDRFFNLPKYVAAEVTRLIINAECEMRSAELKARASSRRLLPSSIRLVTSAATIFAVATLFSGCVHPSKQQPSILVYTHNGLTLDGKKGYVHDNIAECVQAIEKIGAEKNIKVVHSDDPGMFTHSDLKQYRAIIFANSNNKAFDTEQERKVFQDYIHHGGGFLGIHSASGSERDWPWFWQLLGGTFAWHAPFQKFTVHVADKDNPATSFFKGDTWEWEDEFYVMKEQPKGVHVLLDGNIAILKGVSEDKLKSLSEREVTSLEVIRPGEIIDVVFSDTPASLMPAHEKVRLDGTVRLMFDKTFQAAGKTAAELAREIQKAYVPEYFRQLTVSVLRQDSHRFTYMDGEVKQPSKQEYTSRDFSKKPRDIVTAPNEPVIVPLAWCHEFEGGRAFYTALGHKKESYTDPIYVKHLTGAIEWAMGHDLRRFGERSMRGYVKQL